MDIDLLAKMVKELIVEHDEVELPGMGSFIAELVPSTFSDKGYTINPPERHLCFRKKASGSPLLADYYVKTSGLSEGEAAAEILSFISELSDVLKQKKLVILPGLGKLRATKENNFFFIADEDLDIFPEGAGLEPVSLKTHSDAPAEDVPVETSPAERQTPVQVEEMETTSPAPAEEPRKAPEVPAEKPETEKTEIEKPETEKKKLSPALKFIIWLFVLAVIFFAAVYLLGHFAPDFIDKFLYSDEELRILNY